MCCFQAKPERILMVSADLTKVLQEPQKSLYTCITLLAVTFSPITTKLTVICKIGVLTFEACFSFVIGD